MNFDIKYEKQNFNYRRNNEYWDWSLELNDYIIS